MGKTHKKGLSISKVEIDNSNNMMVYSDKGETIKVTRAQRIALCDYKSNDYIENIAKCFQNKNILSDDFEVIKNGSVVYSLMKQYLSYKQTIENKCREGFGYPTIIEK